MSGHGAALLTPYTPPHMVAALSEAPTGMGNAYFGSKGTTGLCQPLIALMPPHSVNIETHGGSSRWKGLDLKFIPTVMTKHFFFVWISGITESSSKRIRRDEEQRAGPRRWQL